MKFINTFKITLVLTLILALNISSKISLKVSIKQNAKFNGEFFSGLFSNLKNPEVVKKLDQYLNECGNTQTSVMDTLKKMNADFKRMDTTPVATSNTLIYVCNSVRNGLRSVLSVMRGCKLVYQYLKTYLDTVWKLILKSSQMGNDIVIDDVMKTIYTDVYNIQKTYTAAFKNNNYGELGKIFSDILRKIVPFST